MDRRRVPAAGGEKVVLISRTEAPGASETTASAPTKSEQVRSTTLTAVERVGEYAQPESPAAGGDWARLRNERLEAGVPVEAREGPGNGAPRQAQRDSNFNMFGVTMEAPIDDRDAAEDTYTHTSGGGPSFLGLTDEPGSGHYLLEDEKRGHGRAWLLVCVLILLGVMAVLQWRADSNVRMLGTQAVNAVKDKVNGREVAANKPTPQEPVAARNDSTTPATGTTPETQTPATPDASAPKPEDQKPAATSDQAASGQQQSAPNQPDATASGDANAASAKIEANSNPEAKDKDEATDNDTTGKAKTSSQPGAKAKSGQREAAQPDSDQQTDEDTNKSKPSAAKAPVDTEAADLYTRAEQSLYGHGGARNCDAALTYLRRSAGRGYARAASQLGALYATGNCAPFDRVTAYRWLTRALDEDASNPYLKQNREMLLREMTAQERQQVMQ